MFIVAKRYILSFEIIGEEMALVAYNEARLSFIQNCQREMIYNPSQVILNQNSFQVSRKSLEELYGKVEEYAIVHHDNRNILNEKYLSVYDTIMNENLCEEGLFADRSLLPVPCKTLFEDGPTLVSIECLILSIGPLNVNHSLF
jgi:hypothetical protein